MPTAQVSVVQFRAKIEFKDTWAVRADCYLVLLPKAGPKGAAQTLVRHAPAFNQCSFHAATVVERSATTRVFLIVNFALRVSFVEDLTRTQRPSITSYAATTRRCPHKQDDEKDDQNRPEDHTEWAEPHVTPAIHHIVTVHPKTSSKRVAICAASVEPQRRRFSVLWLTGNPIQLRDRTSVPEAPTVGFDDRLCCLCRASLK
jgi:hypothetical protein